MKSIRQLAKEHNVDASMVFSRLRKGWTIEESLMPNGWKRHIDIQKKISKLDTNIIYIGGYENRYSKITIKCNRCGNTFERVYERLVEKSKEKKLCCEICQTNNTNNLLQEERETHFKETIEHTQPNIKFISGFKDNKGQVLVECKLCGDRFYRTVDMLMRKDRTVYCFKCERIKRNTIKKMLKEQEQYIKELKRQYRKEIKDIYNTLKNNTLYIKTCIECGNEYVEHSSSKYCPQCRKKIRKKHSNKSLKQLYKRDKGICGICGGKCNWNDKEELNNTIVVGETYPSIDHIIPLAKGGTDDWNNLQLAHFKCNWVKGAWVEE